MRREKEFRELSLECIEPNAAGIDVGAREIYVAVARIETLSRYVVFPPLRRSCKLSRRG